MTTQPTSTLLGILKVVTQYVPPLLPVLVRTANKLNKAVHFYSTSLTSKTLLCIEEISVLRNNQQISLTF